MSAAWTTNFFRGELISCRDHTVKGGHYYDSLDHRAHKFLYGGHDPGVCGLSFQTLALWLLGYPDQALVSSEAGLSLGRELAHPNSLSQALAFASILNRLRRDSDMSGTMAEAVITLCREHELDMFLRWGEIMAGAALADDGRTEEGIARMRAGLSAIREAGARVHFPFFCATLAEALGRAGEPQEALALVDEAQSIMDRDGEIYFQAEILRVRGELLLIRSVRNRSKAEASFQAALKLAREQKVKSLELRGATSLAQLWGKNKRRAEAHDLLSPVYARFTEGFDTPDVKEAKALLDELS